MNEQRSPWDLVGAVRERLLAEFKPDGFNIGLNDGLAAGQTVHTLMFTSSPGGWATCRIHAVVSGGSR
jgi:hypothetical protein